MLAECKTLAKTKAHAQIHCAELGYSGMASNHDDKPRFVEPRRALLKAMARRAKTSHLGAFQILPEHVLLSCLARLPREHHDAVADCSTGFRAIMRSERFIKARRAEGCTEQGLVAILSDTRSLALVSGRVWRCLAPMPPAMRLSYDHNNVATGGITVIGSEIFIAGGIRPSGRYSEVSVYDAVDDEWFALPQPPNFPHYTCVVACAGRLFVGIGKCMKAGQVRDSHEPYFQFWDADSQRWITIPSMPPSMPLPKSVLGGGAPLVAAAVGSQIFFCPYKPWLTWGNVWVFDIDTETWRLLDIPEDARIPDQEPSLYVEGSLLHMLNHVNTTGGHYAYDTDTDEWVYVTWGLPRHVAMRESGRVLAVVNSNGRNDYVPFKGAGQSSGCVIAYRRSPIDDRWYRDGTTPIDLPVRYDAVERVLSVAMP